MGLLPGVLAAVFVSFLAECPSQLKDQSSYPRSPRHRKSHRIGFEWGNERNEVNRPFLKPEGAGTGPLDSRAPICSCQEANLHGPIITGQIVTSGC